MDKRNKRNEISDKKDNRIKDRGDLKKVNDKIIKKNYESTQVGILKVAHPERGDSERKITTNQKSEKMRINIVVKKPTNEESKSKNLIDSTAEKETANKKKFNKDGHEFELRKRIRDRYTLKLKGPGNRSDPSNLVLNKKDDGSKEAAVKSDSNKPVDRPKKQLTEETTQTKERLTEPSTTSIKTDLNPDKKSEKYSAKPDKIIIAKPEKATPKPERNTPRRKPMIKTIMSKSGPVKIYKAVTFVERTRTPTPLEINIPAGDAMKKQKVSKFTDTNSLKFKTKPTVSSKTSVKEKPATIRKRPERRRDKKKRYVRSPERSLKDNLSPPTEVARWAPASIDRQTKPYYEAWVDTTLAAISKGSKKDKLFYEKQRQNILRSFQKALEERPRTPELFYANFADEKYTGRIKITQR